MMEMDVKSIRIPQGSAGSFSGWYTFVRGAMISRRLALVVLIFGPQRGRIETKQSNDPQEWI